MTTIDTRSDSVAALARRLFVPGDRIGWTYVQPAPAAAATEVEPQWLEPMPPDLRALRMRAAAGKHRLRWAAPLGGLLCLVGLAQIAQGGIAALLIGLGVLATALVPMLMANNEIGAVQQRAAADRARRRADFEQARARYAAAVEGHDRAERRRVDTSTLWFPLRLRPHDRIDVLGGTGEARATLLATLGCSLLATHGHVVVLDLTEEGVAAPLTMLSTAMGVPTTSIGLPADLGSLDLLAGLDAMPAAELLAEVVHPRLHGTGQDDPHHDVRDLAADLVVAVLSRFDAEPTLSRLVDGLRVLHKTYDARAGGSVTEAELVRLTDAAHDVVTGERSRDELRLLISRLQLLVEPAAGRGRAFQPLVGTGLTVVTTESAGNLRRKDVLDRLLVGLALRALQTSRRDRSPVDLVVAGSDRLGTVVLESMARAAALSSVRLVYLFEHLRDAALPLLGGPNSTAIVMRLGNKDEAAAAAGFIGHEHRFVLGQVSRQMGTTSTVGGGTSSTSGTSTSQTHGSQRGGSRSGLQGGSNWGTSESTTHGESHSSGTNRTWSIADSYTDGQVDTRVYEYAVEPTTIQALPPTSFVLVDRSAGRSAAVMGNCDPRITELDRVEPEPR